MIKKNILKYIKIFYILLASVISIESTLNCSLIKAQKTNMQNIIKKESYYENYTLENMPDVVKSVVNRSNKKTVSLSKIDANKKNRVTLVNEDGTKTTHIFPYDIKYTKDNKINFISDKISFSNEKDYDYKNSDGDITKSFSKNIDTGVKIEHNGKSVKMYPLSALDKKMTPIKKNDTIKCNKKNNGIVYENIYTNNINIEYESAINGIKENIILSKYEGINVFSFIINTNGLIPQKMYAENDSIALLDPKSKNVEMIINQVYAFDSASNEIDGKHVTLNNKISLEKTSNENEYKLSVIVDKDYLQDEKTIYPVTIDPALTIPSGYIQNTMVYELSPNERNWWSSIMFVGKHNIENFGDCQMFIRYTDIDKDTYISPSFIEQVYFNIYEWSGHTYPATIELYDLSSKTWTYDGINYINKPSTYGTRQSHINYPPSNTWSRFDITNLFKSWLKNRLNEGGFSNDYGFCLKATSDNLHSRYYYSSTDSKNPPTITISYREDTSVQNDVYYIKNKHTNKYLDADIHYDDKVITYPFKGQANQEWRIEIDSETGLYKLYNLWFGYDGKALDTDLFSGKSKVGLWPGNSNGAWVYYRLVKNRDGTYRIMTSYGQNNRALTSGNNAEEYITDCYFSNYTDSDEQKWILEKATLLNMPERTINVKVVIDQTYRNEYKSYYSTIKKEFENANYAFKHIFNISFNQIYYADTNMPNYLCNNPVMYEGCNNICGTNCENHHRGWNRGLNTLMEHYPANSNPRDLVVGITATGLCYNAGGVHSSAGGLTLVGGQYAIIPKPIASHWNNIGSVRRQQHEFTHYFGLSDGPGCTPNQRCIMNGGMDNIIFDNVGNIWCDSCKEKIKKFITQNW